MTNVTTTTYTKHRFEYEMDTVTLAKGRAAAAQKKRLAKRLVSRPQASHLAERLGEPKVKTRAQMH